MSDFRLTRQQIYDRIKQTSKEEYILEEMKRLGFWDVSEGAPKVSEKLITDKGELRRELNDLVEKQRKFQDKEQLLKEMREKRMKEALARRAVTKEKRKKEREEKAERWKTTKEKDIVYLGKEVSGGLNEKEGNAEKLQTLGLPLFNTLEELAAAMQLSIGQLRFLTYHRKTSKTSHYKRFYLPKKTGGKRLISAPMPKLKNAQYWVLQNILYKRSLHEAAHGFVPQRSIVTNASAHSAKEVVINVDMKDFFPTVTYRRVKGLFRGMGYSEQLATVLALLCTEPQIDEVELDGQIYFVAQGERYLPQGAPTSPAITNILCSRLDSRFAGMAAKLGWSYTRYADDLSFSSNQTRDVNRVLWQAKQIVESEGFVLHPKKIKVMRKGAKQEVTGIVVNKTLNVPREKLKQFRAVLHHIERKGLEGANWGNGFILFTIQGFANYVQMVNPEKGAPLVAKVKAILEKPEIKAALSAHFNQPKPPKIKEKKAAVAETVYTDTALDAKVTTQTKQAETEDWWKLW